MKEPATNFWNFKLLSDDQQGKQKVIAEYIVEADQTAVDRDLTSGFNALQRYLKPSLGVDATDYIKKNPMMAASLLAGLLAVTDCVRRLGVSLPANPPPAIACQAPGEGFEPLPSEIARLAGVRLWLRQGNGSDTGNG